MEEPTLEQLEENLRKAEIRRNSIASMSSGSSLAQAQQDVRNAKAALNAKRAEIQEREIAQNLSRAKRAKLEPELEARSNKDVSDKIVSFLGPKKPRDLVGVDNPPTTDNILAALRAKRSLGASRRKKNKKIKTRKLKRRHNK
jgi:hypothetical protein